MKINKIWSMKVGVRRERILVFVTYGFRRYFKIYASLYKNINITYKPVEAKAIIGMTKIAASIGKIKEVTIWKMDNKANPG